MNRGAYEGFLRLEPQQELLLRAALLKGEGAVESCRQWKSSVNVERLDPASHRILPLLYRNLLTHGVSDPSMGIYKGVYRQTWYKNQLLFHTLASVLRSFGSAGIETIVLKGAALTVLNYKDHGLRPMNDCDVLIHADRVSDAINLLRELGWKPMNFEPTEEYISVRHAHGFMNGKGQEFDLHWHVMSQSRDMDADNDFWDGAITVNINGVATRALNPTDQLLHVCIHGARWNYIPPFRWMADAMMVLSTSSGIDWDRVIAQAEKRRVVLPLRDSLNYLLHVVDAPVPADVLRNIQAMPVPRIEYMEYKINVSPRTRWTAALDLWCQHSRLMKNGNLLHRLVGFPIFLQRMWGRSLWKLPFFGLLKVMTWRKSGVEKKA